MNLYRAQHSSTHSVERPGFHFGGGRALGEGPQILRVTGLNPGNIQGSGYKNEDTVPTYKCFQNTLDPDR